MNVLRIVKAYFSAKIHVLIPLGIKNKISLVYGDLYKSLPFNHLLDYMYS